MRTKIEVLEEPSIKDNMPCQRIMMIEAIHNDWRGKIINYLEFEIQPENPIEARKLKIRAARHQMIEGELFRQSFFRFTLAMFRTRPSQVSINQDP